VWSDHCQAFRFRYEPARSLKPRYTGSSIGCGTRIISCYYFADISDGVFGFAQQGQGFTTEGASRMDVRGKVCLITGGTSGIGAAVALALARRGSHIAVVGRTFRKDTLNRLKSEAKGSKSKFLFIKADIADRKGCIRCVAKVHAVLGNLDILVHAAGEGVPGNLFQVTDEQWMKAFDTHVHAIFWLARAAVPYMTDGKEGAILLIGSAAGLRGGLGALAYSVAKGVIPQFTRALARELADDNIRVNCVSPGVIRTPFQNMLSATQVETNINSRIPLHREGQPEDVASAIVLLLENQFITGENLIVDGGMTMRIV